MVNMIMLQQIIYWIFLEDNLPFLKDFPIRAAAKKMKLSQTVALASFGQQYPVPLKHFKILLLAVTGQWPQRG